MAQQINLFNPILLTPKRYFSALAMAQALAAVALGIVAMCVWVLLQTSHLRTQSQADDSSRRLEREQLEIAIANLPAQKDTAALEQELRATTQAVTERQQMLDEVTRGLISNGRSHSALLKLIAQTTPPSAWLSLVRLSHGRLEITGNTLEPAALQPWIVALGSNPLLAGQQLANVKVERVAASDPPRTQPDTIANVENWYFTVLSDSPTAQRAASASNKVGQ